MVEQMDVGFTIALLGDGEDELRGGARRQWGGAFAGPPHGRRQSKGVDATCLGRADDKLHTSSTDAVPNRITGSWVIHPAANSVYHLG